MHGLAMMALVTYIYIYIYIYIRGSAGEAKIVDEDGYELRNPTADPNQPRL